MAVSAMQLVGRISIEGADKAESQLKQVDAQGKRAQSTLDRLHPSSQLTGKAFGTNLFGGVKTATGGILDFASKASLAGMGIAALVKGATTLAGAFFAPNASLEQMRVSFGAFIEDSKQLESTMDGLKKFATTTPFETPEINKAALALLNMDVAAQDLTKWLGNVGAAVAKIGGGGQQFEDITQIIAQMGVEGKITTGEMMQLQERNIPAFKILAKEMGVPVARLKEMISNSELGADKIELFVGALGKFGGDAMIAQSKTWNGMLSTIADTARDIWTAFTGSAFEKARGSMGSFLDVVSANQKSIMEFATGAGNAIGDTFAFIGEAFQMPSMSVLMEKLGQVWEAFKNVGGAVFDLWNTLSPISILFDSTSKSVGDGETALDNFAISIFKVQNFLQTYITPALNGFAHAIRGITAPLKRAREMFEGFVGRGNTAIPLIAGIAGVLATALVPALWSAVPALLATAAGVIATTWPLLAIGGAIAGVTALFLHFYNSNKGFKSAIDGIGKSLGQFASMLAGGVTDAIKFISPYFAQAGKAIADFGVQIADRIAPIVTQWFKDIDVSLKGFMRIWNAAWPSISGVLKGQWDAMVGTLKIAWALISGVIKIGLDLLSGNWEQAWEDFKEMLVGVWDGIKTYLKGALISITSAFTPLFQAMANIPGPAGDMAKSVLEAFDTLKGGTALKTREAKEQATLHTLEMKIAAVKNAEDAQIGVIQRFDRMRMGIIEQLSKTTDETEKQALQIKLKQVTHAEDAAVKTWEKHKEMRKNAEGEHKKLKKNIEDNSGGIIGSIQRSFGRIGQQFTSWFNEAKNGITGAFEFLGGWFQDRWEDVQNIWGAAGQRFRDIGHGIWNGITGALGFLGRWFQDRWNEVMNHTAPFRDYMSKVFETIWNILVALWGKLGAKFNEWLESAKSFLAPFVTAVRDKFTEAWNAVTGAFQFLGNWFADRWNDAKGPLIAFGITVKEKLTEAWNNVVWAFQWLGKWFTDRWNDAKAPVIAFVNTAKEKLTEAWNNTVALFAPLGKMFQDRWNDVMNGVNTFKTNIANKFNEIKTNVTNIFKGMINGIIDQLNNGIGSVERFINFIGQGLNDIAKGLGTKGTIPVAHLGRIPRYASGTDSHPGGAAIVGEEGRELVFLPKGAKVAPNDVTEAMLSMTGGKIPGYASGIGDIAGNIMNWIGSGAKVVLDNVIRAMNISAPNLPGMGNIAGAIFEKVKNWAVGWIDKILPKFDFGGENVPGNVQSWIAQAMSITKVPANWAGALATIAMKESGGNPKAINLWDSNAKAGIPSQGLFQTIPPTFRAHMLPGFEDILNPIHNAIAAIRYIISRYGTVFNVPGIRALAAGKPYVGYAGGTDFAPGGWSWVGERGAELMYVPRGARIVPNQNIASGERAGGPVIVHVHNYIDGKEITDTTANRMIRSARSSGPIRSNA